MAPGASILLPRMRKGTCGGSGGRGGGRSSVTEGRRGAASEVAARTRDAPWKAPRCSAGRRAQPWTRPGARCRPSRRGRRCRRPPGSSRARGGGLDGRERRRASSHQRHGHAARQPAGQAGPEQAARPGRTLLVASEVVRRELDVADRELLRRRVERRLEGREPVILEHVEERLEGRATDGTEVRRARSSRTGRQSGRPRG